MKLANVLLIFLFLSFVEWIETRVVDSPDPCGNGHYFVQTNACYFIGHNSTWYHAIDHCKRQGGQLASVHSVAENDFILGLRPGTGCTRISYPYTSDYWLGGFYDSGWHWVDGSPFDYEAEWYKMDFRSSRRIMLGGDIDCVDFGQWTPSSGYDKVTYFVCKKEL